MIKHICAIGMLSICTVPAFAQQTQGDPKKTEVWEPVPTMVAPGKTPTAAPADAIVLFDGKNLNQWQAKKGGAAKWKLEPDGAMTVVKGTGDIMTKQGFGSCQLHIEWRTPAKVESEGQGRGNSGIFLMGRYELQILDSYNNRTYSNGQAGSLYKQYIPLVNVSKKPGEWQVYDVVFTAPTFFSDGNMATPAKFTVFHNGVLIQNNVELKGNTVYIGQPFYEAHNNKEPIILQDHGNPVSFRNIWIREL